MEKSWETIVCFCGALARSGRLTAILRTEIRRCAVQGRCRLAQSSCCRRLSGTASAAQRRQRRWQWDARMKQAVLEALLALMQEIPVYALQCRADGEAVDCLAQRLKTDGVISWR